MDATLQHYDCLLQGQIWKRLNYDYRSTVLFQTLEDNIL